MRYFGVPTCPYCKKRVNLIRTWSLKRQGEYQCPRCGGISNIFLSPLIYVLALIAVFGGGAMYFFYKFVLDDVTLETALYVFIPFAAFFLFSLFMVYLEKPVIKKVSKEEYEKKRLIRSAVAESPNARASAREEYYDDDSYRSRGSYRPGPEASQTEERHGVVNQAAFSRAKLQAAVENSQGVVIPRAKPSQPAQQQRPVQPQAVPARRPAGAPQQQRASRPAANQPAPQPGYAQRPVAQRPAQQYVQSVPRQQALQQAPRQQAAQQRAPQQKSFSQQGAAMQQQYRPAGQARPGQAAQRPAARNMGAPRQSGRVVGGIETPINQSSYLDKYDDPTYIQRRMKEMGQNNQNSRK